MKKRLLSFFLSLSIALAFAQDKQIEGTITDASDKMPVIGANIFVKGTKIGTTTDVNGHFVLGVTVTATTLSISYIGKKTQEVPVPESGVINLALEDDSRQINEVVVTALGVKRETKSVGYATQKVTGSSLSDAKDANIVNSLQGKVAGVQITGNSNIGGSSRITIRGIKSLTGQNQPLFVIDGIVVDNSNYADAEAVRGALGYDYGNAAQDLNSDDIEDMQVLKGPAAAALYGSRGANGVILITTKKGSKHAEKGKSPIGVSFQQDLMFNQVNVLPNYQNKYGAGYGDGFLPDEDFPNDPTRQRVKMEDDASWGPKMDGQQVRQWTSYYPNDPANYQKTTPFVAHPNNVKDFYQMGLTSNSNIALDGANDKGGFRLSFSNLSQKGTVPNSSLKRNTLSFTGNYNFTDKLFADISANYVLSEGKGRPQIGYESVYSNFNQWWERQLDIKELKNYKNPDGSQHTWNLINDGTKWTPYFWDNPYWTVYENYETDRRDRVFGRVNAGYKIAKWLTVKGAVSTDFYQDFRDERIAVNSVAISKYTQHQITYNEMNYELTLTAHKVFKNDYDISGFIGVNRRDEHSRDNLSYTQGGLNVPNLYTLENSVSAVKVDNLLSKYRSNSVFGSVSFGWRGMLFVDVTGRNDWSSSLPLKACSYFYPSVSGSFVFSELVKSSWFTFGKLRGGWAMVGNDTRPYRLETRPKVSSPFGSSGIFVNENTLNNSNLRPEKVYSWEIGLELNFFVDRIHIDATYYNSVTKDNIFKIQQSGASGSTYRYANAGVLANQGVELATSFMPVKTKSGFSWTIGFNFAKNYNKVKELYKDENGKDITSLNLGTAPFSATLEARPGMAYGQIVGTDFYYDKNGSKIIDPATGLYMINQNVKPLGSILPDFTGGVSTTLSFKGISAFFLFDFQKGGHLFSLTNTWGKVAGTLAETATDGMRENGIVAEGVNMTGTDANGNPISDGTKNTTNIDALTYFQNNYNGYNNTRVDVYDATFVKFREFRLTYTFSTKLLSKTPIRGINIGIIGRNLAILKKNVPHIDPEVANSSNNIQGFEGGNKPAERSIGLTFGFKF